MKTRKPTGAKRAVKALLPTQRHAQGRKLLDQAAGHPLRGSTDPVRSAPNAGMDTRSDPIRDPEAILAVKRLLAAEPRNLALFTLGVNNGLRAGDLLRLTVGQVRHLGPGECVQVREGKTGKLNVLCVNRASYRALKAYLDAADPEDDAPLFPNPRTGEPLTVTRVNQLVKEWTRAVGLQGQFGAHTLRKTFGYQQRVQFGVAWEILTKRFNHSSPGQTRAYLGIADAEVAGVLLNEI